MAQVSRWVVIGALFLISFVPLYVANSMFFPFITGKGFLFRFLVEIASIGWVVLALLDSKYRPRFSWLFLIYGALVVWMFIADLLAINPHKAFWSNYERMDGWVTMVHVFLLFVVASSVLSVGKLWQKWWLTFLAGSAIVCGYGVLQILGVLQTHQGGRIDATFGNAAYLPAYLLFGIAIALWQGSVRAGWLRYSLFALAALQVGILLFTATRGALFGLLGAVVFGAVVYAFHSGKTAKYTAIGLLVGVTILAGSFYLAKDTTFVHESNTLSRLSSVFSLSQELGVRSHIWGIALTGFAERPITGYGHEGFNYVFNTHYEPQLFAQEQWFDRAHDIYLDWLIAGGAPALLLFLLLLGYAALVLFRKEFSRSERIFILGAFVAYGIQGLVVFDNLFTYVPLAMLLAYIHTRIAKPTPLLESLTLREPVRSVGVTIVVLAGLWGMWVVNVPGIKGATTIISSFSATDARASIQTLDRAVATGTFATQEIREQMIARLTDTMARPEVAPEIKRDVATIALTQMQAEVAQAPRDARLHLQFATGLRAVGDFPTALSEIEAALSLSPNKQTILLEKGATLWQMEDAQGARDAFYAAYTLDTSFAQVAGYAGAGDILIGNRIEGEALLRQYFAPTLYDVPDVVLVAYQAIGDTQAIIDIYHARVAADNGSADSRFRLAGFYAQIGRYADARAEVLAIVKDFPDMSATAQQWLTALDQAQ